MDQINTQIQRWETDDNRFCFQFYFERFIEEKKIELYYTISYLTVTGTEKMLFKSTRLIPSNNDSSSFNSTESGFQIVGTIKALTRTEDHSEFVVIWGDFYYGVKINLKNYEGVLLVKEISNIHPEQPSRPEPGLPQKK